MAWLFWGARAVTLGVLVSFASATGAIAQQRSEARQEPPQQNSGSIPGIQVFVGAEGGYDTNLDNRVARQGSHYEMLQAGLSGTFKVSDAESYSLYVRGRNYWYDELALDNRYDIDVAGGARYDLSPSTALRLGASWLRDAIPENRVDVFKANGDLVNEEDFYRARLRFDSRTEISFSDDRPGTLAPDVFSIVRNKAFDFSKNGATASILLARKAMIAPFLLGNVTNVDYFNQSPGASIDRNANEVYGIAGIRLTLGTDFSVDVGARINRRDFDDPTVRRFTGSSFDGRFTWKVATDTTIKGIIERQIKEPTTSFGLADDVLTYELGIERKSGPWSVYARGFLDNVRPIGDDFNFRKYNWSSGFTYELSSSAELYGDYLGKYVRDEMSGESYMRHRVGAGVKFKF